MTYSWYEIESLTRRAFPKDYLSWLKGYTECGGEITHRYSYGLPSQFLVALGDIQLPPLYGANSIKLIVPDGVKVTAPDGFGHTTVYDMGTFQTRGSRHVPVYGNTKIPAQSSES